MTTFGELCCEVCGISGSVTAMHRNNPIGEKAHWRCAPCLDTPPDAEVLAVTDLFECDNLDIEWFDKNRHRAAEGRKEAERRHGRESSDDTKGATS